MKRKWPEKDFGVLCAVVVLAALSGQARAADSQSEHVRARLVADVQSIRPGTAFRAAVHLRMEKDWHVNWINPGDAGLAPSIAWELPDGFKVSELFWPYPRQYRIGPIVIYGYDDELLLTALITPPVELPAKGDVVIGAEVDWLACAEACVPGGAEIKLELPVSSSYPKPDEKWRPAFEAAEADHPLPSATWRVQAFVDDEERYVLEVRSIHPRDIAIARCQFFPTEPDVIEHAERQIFSARYGGCDLILKRAHMSLEIPVRISGVLVSEPGWDSAGNVRAISIDVPLEPR